MTETTPNRPGAGRTLLLVVAWLWVLVPFAYGVGTLLLKLPALF